METAKCMVDSVAILVELTEKQCQQLNLGDDLTASVENAVAQGNSSLAIKEVVKFVSSVIWDACHPRRGVARSRRRDLTRTVLQWTNCESFKSRTSR